MARTIGWDALERRVRAAGADALVPARLAGAVPTEATPVLRDVLALDDRMLLAVLRHDDEFLIAPLVAEGDAVRRAHAGDGVFASILRAIGSHEMGDGFVGRRYGDLPPGITERAIDVDQSNDSVVVDDAAIVKLYPRTSPGIHPALETPAHLAEVGFAETPALLGSLVWAGEGDGEVLLATVTDLLPGARDGWDWHVELLEEVADGGRPPAAWARPAAALGALVARLHAALATASSVFPTPRSLATSGDVATWMRRAEGTFTEALALTDGPEGERLRAHGPAIRRAFAAADGVTSTPTARIHGDLHVGQLLPWEGGFAAIDFEGNPLQSPQERGALGSPARDVASMVRSLDHVGRIVQRRRPDRVSDIGSWIAAARGSFLDAYGSELDARSVSGLFDERLLHPFEVAQECHEYVYAARYLPRWRYVPDLAMPALVGDG